MTTAASQSRTVRAFDPESFLRRRRRPFADAFGSPGGALVGDAEPAAGALSSGAMCCPGNQAEGYPRGEIVSIDASVRKCPLCPAADARRVYRVMGRRAWW